MMAHHTDNGCTVTFPVKDSEPIRRFHVTADHQSHGVLHGNVNRLEDCT